MINTFLSDDVINSTQLRNNQKQWLERAVVSPVSVKSGNINLVLLNREYVKDMHLLNHYAKMIIQFCREMDSEQAGKSDVFPWIKHLSKEAIAEFHRELLLTFNDVIHSGNWVALEEMLDDWEATAEVESNPSLARALLAEEDSSKYVEIKD